MEDNESNVQNDLISGIASAIRTFFSPKPLDVIHVVMNHKPSLGYALAGMYILISALASLSFAMAPLRMANVAFGLGEIPIPYGELLYRGITFGVLTLFVFVACMHFYLSTMKRQLPLVRTINFVAACLLPAMIFSFVAFILGFLHLTTAIILMVFGIFASALLAVVGVSKVVDYDLPMTWSAILFFGASTLIYFWLFGWTAIAPIIAPLFTPFI